MMEWLLILTFSFGGTDTDLAVGYMLDAKTCAIAAAGMTEILEAANPGLTVSASCVQGESA